ncbi:MAG: hypothetical protein CL678_01075 [Bdellovibrionaceae bacterium]|nr:hypothetical protein [Pseudobdellovibrionaceae bacterium]
MAKLLNYIYSTFSHVDRSKPAPPRYRRAVAAHSGQVHGAAEAAVGATRTRQLEAVRIKVY